MNDLEYGIGNCTLTALTRVFSYYEKNYCKNNIPDAPTLYKDIRAIAVGYGRPMLLNILSGYYADHTVTVVGYCTFSKGTGIFKDTGRFLKVYDGWNLGNRYIVFLQLSLIKRDKMP